MKRLIQNSVAESGLTLPAFSLFALCLWQPWTFASPFEALPMVVLLMACYVLMEWCNRYQVIRVRSRLTTSVFVLGASVLCRITPCGTYGLLMALGVACILYTMTSCYDRHEPVVAALHASFSLSVMSLIVPQVLWLLPALLFCMAVYMRVLSLRVFSAIVMGALLPWIIVGTWLLLAGDGWDVEGAVALLPFYDCDCALYPFILTPAIVCWTVISLAGVVSLLRFIMRSYDDKIRVRMIFYAVIMLWVALEVVMVLSRQYFVTLLPALWLLSCPLLSHHLALSSSRWTTLWFVIIMLCLCGGAIYSFMS